VPQDIEAGSGWKIHVRVDDTVAGNMEKAWGIISRLVDKYGIPSVKMLRKDHDLVARDTEIDTQAHKQFTIYFGSNGVVEKHSGLIKEFLEELDATLLAEGIVPGPEISSASYDRKLSDYLSYRNDCNDAGNYVIDGGLKFVNAEPALVRRAYNLSNQSDPFSVMDLSLSDGAMASRPYEDYRAAIMLRRDANADSPMVELEKVCYCIDRGTRCTWDKDYIKANSYYNRALRILIELKTRALSSEFMEAIDTLEECAERKRDIARLCYKVKGNGPSKGNTRAAYQRGGSRSRVSDDFECDIRAKERHEFVVPGMSLPIKYIEYGLDIRSLLLRIEEYIDKRASAPMYQSTTARIFGGYSRDDKIAAASALCEALKSTSVSSAVISCAESNPALNDGVLAKEYAFVLRSIREMDAKNTRDVRIQHPE